MNASNSNSSNNKLWAAALMLMLLIGLTMSRFSTDATSAPITNIRQLKAALGESMVGGPIVHAQSISDPTARTVQRFAADPYVCPGHEGDIYGNTTSNTMKYCNGTSWGDLLSASGGALTLTSVTANLFKSATSGTVTDGIFNTANNERAVSMKKFGSSNSCGFKTNASDQIEFDCPLFINPAVPVPWTLTNIAGDYGSPSNGMVQYNTTTNKFRGYENGAWVNMVGGGSSNPTPQTGLYYAPSLVSNCGNTITDGLMVQAVSGGGIATTTPPVANWVGGCTLNTSSSTTGQAAWRTQSSGGVTRSILFGGGAWDLTMYFRSGANLSDGTDTYRIQAGFIESFGSATPTDGAYFRYIHSVNSGKWECVLREASAETAADTGVTFAVNTNYTIRVTVNAAGTAAQFFLNGSEVCAGMSQTNLPNASGSEVGWGMMILKSAGTAQRNLLARAMILSHTFTTPW